jgi:membrane protease YdiL (CAAX protease family)
MPPENTEAPQEVSTAPSEGRNFLGWVILAILFTLLGTSAIYEAVTRTEGGTRAYSSEELQLRMHVSNRALFKTLGTEVDERTADSLGQTISDLIPETANSASAARLYAAMRTELGRPVPKERLKVLEDSKNRADRAVFRIYTEEKFTIPQAKRIAAALPDKPYSFELARIHALEKAGDTTARQGVTPWLAIKMLSIAGIGLLLLFAGVALWIFYIVLRANGQLKPDGHPIGRVTLADADRLALRAAQILCGYLGLSFLVSLLAAQKIISGPASTIVTAIAIVAFVVAIARVPIAGKRFTMRSLGVTRDRLGRDILWGLAGFVAEIPLTALMAAAGFVLFQNLPSPTHSATEQVLNSSSLWSSLPIILFGALVAPFWEEVLFRGILFPAFGRITGSVLYGLVVSSLLFGLIHPQGPILVLALSSVGAVSCLLAYQTRSLIPSIVLHIAHNGAIFIALVAMAG